MVNGEVLAIGCIDGTYVFSAIVNSSADYREPGKASSTPARLSL
jgi:hypothetical protein